MSVKLISITKPVGELSHLTPEELIGYVARVSNEQNQMNLETTPKLLTYCIRQKHWSIFEQVAITIEIQTSRGISAQILRHRSFSFQEFSQRYAKVCSAVTYEARRQDTKNRQNSLDDLSPEVKQWFLEKQQEVQDFSKKLYEEALQKQVAKECARFLLPMSTATKLYMTGSVRSWITYLLVRLDQATQLEHRQIAEGCWSIFREQFPIVSSVLTSEYPNTFRIPCEQ